MTSVNQSIYGGYWDEYKLVSFQPGQLSLKCSSSLWYHYYHWGVGCSLVSIQWQLGCLHGSLPISVKEVAWQSHARQLQHCDKKVFKMNILQTLGSKKGVSMSIFVFTISICLNGFSVLLKDYMKKGQNPLFCHWKTTIHLVYLIVGAVIIHFYCIVSVTIIHLYLISSQENNDAVIYISI